MQSSGLAVYCLLVVLEVLCQCLVLGFVDCGGESDGISRRVHIAECIGDGLGTLLNQQGRDVLVDLGNHGFDSFDHCGAGAVMGIELLHVGEGPIQLLRHQITEIVLPRAQIVLVGMVPTSDFATLGAHQPLVVFDEVVNEFAQVRESRFRFTHGIKPPKNIY